MYYYRILSLVEQVDMLDKRNPVVSRGLWCLFAQETRGTQNREKEFWDESL